MDFEGLEKLIFLISEEVLLLLNELSDDIGEQAQGIRQILDVVVSLAAHSHQLAEHRVLRKQLEAVLVVAELHQHRVRVQGHLVVTLVLVR